MPSRGRLKHRKAWRIESARIRQDYSNSLRPIEKLDELDRRLGVNQGAAKEREKLNLLVFG